MRPQKRCSLKEHKGNGVKSAISQRIQERAPTQLNREPTDGNGKRTMLSECADAEREDAQLNS